MVLGRYRLHRRLGTGAFGTVWLGRDERLDREVAVKVLPRERVVGGRFEREARAAARLAHPGIVTLYEAAVDDDGAYLVSELVSGFTLAELIEGGRLSDRDVAQIGVALCDALAHAHAHGVVHRDVKPSNVLVPETAASPAQLAKLTDFGVARVVGGDALTRTGDVVGTAAYMAPEQAEGRPAGAAADLYSLALVLYEALTGINPLRAGAATRRARRLGAYLPPVRRHRRDLPRELGRAIDLALRPRARERGTVAELRQALSASISGLEASPLAAPAPVGVLDAPQEELLALDLEEDPESRVSRLARLLSGVAAAGIAAWVIASQLHGAPSAVAVAAAAAGISVAWLLRAGWLVMWLALSAILSAQGRVGSALVLGVGALVPLVLLPTQPTRWSLSVLAPALGAVGLAATWPALASRAASAWQRAALGAAGWVWLELAGVLAHTGLYAHLPDTIPGSPAWSSSASAAVHEALVPLASSGALAPALAWAAAAASLPVVLRQTDLLIRAGVAAVWSALLLGASLILLSTGSGHPGIGAGKALLGVAAGMAAALLAGGPAGSILGGRRRGRSAADSRSMKSP